MARTRLLALLAVILTGFSPAAVAQTCKGGEALTAFGTWFSPNVELTGTTGPVPIPVTAGGRPAASARFLLQVLSPGPPGSVWSVVVRDARHRPLISLTRDDFVDTQGRTNGVRWTGRLPGSQFLFQLTGPDAANGVRVQLSDGVAMPASAQGDVRFFSLQNDAQPAWVDLYQSRSTSVRESGDAVGMIYGGREQVSISEHAGWCCTGVLVARDLLLTNWHCGGPPEFGRVWDAVTCGNSLVDFSWDDGAVRRQFGCTAVVAESQALDYAILRLRPVLGEGARTEGFVFPRIRAAPVAAGEDIYIVHHAQCRPKLLSAQCNVGSVGFPSWAPPALAASTGIPPDPEITHRCDTEPGASGAPVFDVAGRLIALHHLGFKRDETCRPLDRVNKAVEIRHIIDHLRVTAADIYEEIRGSVD